MTGFLHFIKTLNNYFWNGPLLLFLLFTHIYFTFRTGFVQKHILSALKLSLDAEKSHGTSGAFTALATTLAATLGTGNIIGLSTAVAIGGPGAVFWCWITGVLGMGTSYTECYLSLKYREQRSDGSFYGGPMVLLQRLLHSPHVAKLYAWMLLLSAFFIGCSAQSRAATETLERIFRLPSFPSGFCLALLITVALLGGFTGIGTICRFLVPFIGCFFLLSCAILLLLHIEYLRDALSLILSSAFSFSAASGGFLGSSFLLAARQGIAKGLFTNEAGLGSAPVAAAHSDGDSHSRALVLMSATFWDTVVMCGITGLVIVCCGLAVPDLYEGIAPGDYTLAAFSLLPVAGEQLLGISIILFAVATLLGWCFFGEQAVEFLFGAKKIPVYRFFYCIMVFFGSQITMNLIWEFSDFLNGLMFLINVTSLFLLRNHLEKN